ncbi:hypothetical protein BYT27DRAFT_7258195 [Phlegmacium glaucopus]|nr:hypothetical protein BYT27DRAFT_7258195 [Phlegmacium glaucopus]
MSGPTLPLPHQMDVAWVATERSPALRVTSPIIACYPWQTAVLEVTDLNTVFNHTHLKNFLVRLAAFEAYISTASTGEWLMLRQFLHFERKYSHLPTELAQGQAKSEGIITSLSPKNKTALTSLLFAYRIVDVAAVLDGLPEISLTHKHATCVEGLENLERLHNWPELLTKFQLTATLDPMATTQSDGVASNAKHMKVLSNLVRHKASTRVFINIQLAVITLHRMVTESQFDLSEGPSSMLLNESGLSAEDQMLLENFFTQSDKPELALRLALFVSPLTLLIPKSLHKVRTDYFRVAMAGKALGNQRPPLLAHVEKEVWSCLFRLATQDLNMFTEMKDCMAKMPWDELSAMGDSFERYWFKPARGDVSSTSLSTADVEGEIPSGWAVTLVSKTPLPSPSVFATPSQAALPQLTLAPPSPGRPSIVRECTISEPEPMDVYNEPSEGAAAFVNEATLPFASNSSMQDVMAVEGMVFSDRDEGEHEHDMAVCENDVEAMSPYEYRPDEGMVEELTVVYTTTVHHVEEGMVDGGEDDSEEEDNDDEVEDLEVVKSVDEAPKERGTLVDYEDEDEEQEDEEDEDEEQEDEEDEDEEQEEEEDEEQTKDTEMAQIANNKKEQAKNQKEHARGRKQEQQSIAVDGDSDDCQEEQEEQVENQKKGTVDDDDEEEEEEEEEEVRQVTPPNQHQRYQLRNKISRQRPSSKSTTLQGKRKQPPSSPAKAPTKKAKKTMKDGCSQQTAINVDELFLEDSDTNLELDYTMAKVYGEPFVGYGPGGNAIPFTPLLHIQADLERLKTLDKAIKAGFFEGHPLHQVDPARKSLEENTS